MRARFLEPHPPARLVEKGGKVYAFLCLDEEVFEETYEGSGAMTVYEYDYHEVAKSADAIDAQDVQAHPEKYMSYTPDPQTMESRLEKLTAQINALAAAQLDMATTEYINQQIANAIAIAKV